MAMELKNFQIAADAAEEVVRLQPDNTNGIFDTAMNRPNKIAPRRTNMTMQVMSNVSLDASTSLSTVRSLRKSPKSKTDAAPAPPAWVALNQPVIRPPRTRAKRTPTSISAGKVFSFS